MRYVMKQKWLSMGDDYAIETEDGRQVYFVDGRAFSWGDKLTMRDASGNEVAYIAQRMFSWGPTYEIWERGQLFAVVKKQMFTFFSCKFSVDVPGPEDYEASGDFLDREYAFTRGGGTVARVSKRFFTWTDTYGVEVAEGEDAVTILAAAVVIDLCCHGDKEH